MAARVNMLLAVWFDRVIMHSMLLPFQTNGLVKQVFTLLSATHILLGTIMVDLK